MTPLRVRVEDLDGGEAEAYAFHRSPVRVGRGALNDLRLDRPYVSTFHGLIQFDDDGIRFVDLGSTNGTLLDGERLARNAPAPIGLDSELTIGRLRLVLTRGATEGRMAPAEPKTSFAQRVALDVGAAEAAAMVVAPPPAGPTGAEAPAPPTVARDLEAPPPAPVPPEWTPPAPPSAALDPAAERALEAASWQLGILHETCQRANDDFRTALDQALAPLSEEQRRRAHAAAAERYPQAGGAGAAASTPPAPPSGGVHVPAAAMPGSALGDEALRLVRAFAEAYLSAADVPSTPGGLERFLGALAEALETAARGYLELRSGYEQFGREMGIRVPAADGVLGRLSDPRQLVGWLVQVADGGESRPRQFAGAFADLMIHQVALLNGVQAGARSLLDELSPEALERSAERGGLGLKALREAALWRAFVDKHQELMGEESAITAALFGSAFARAYSAVVGRRAPGDPTPEPSTPSRKR